MATRQNLVVLLRVRTFVVAVTATKLPAAAQTRAREADRADLSAALAHLLEHAAQYSQEGSPNYILTEPWVGYRFADS